jgi:hypothetical protein
MKTAVDAVCAGKEHQFNRCFSQMCAHHLVEPTACTLAAGWEKGRSRTGLIRERFFSPRASREQLRGTERMASRQVRGRKIARFDFSNQILRDRKGLGYIRRPA